jgi:hypothetical protein
VAPYIQYTKSRSNKNTPTYTHTHTKRLFENKEQRLAKKNLGKIINEEAFVIQHETEYYHCWIDRDIGWIGGKENRET